jgi:hypothetical protein
VGLSGAVVINGLGSTAIPETGRVWDMWREGAAFSYRVPVANGTYQVTLGFLEPTVTAPGARVFNVSVNGATQLSNLDVFQAAGARNTAIARSFPVTVSTTVNCCWSSKAPTARPSCRTSPSSSSKTAGRRSSTEVSLRRRGARTTQ